MWKSVQFPGGGEHVKMVIEVMKLLQKTHSGETKGFLEKESDCSVSEVWCSVV